MTEHDRFGLQVQRLKTTVERTLVVASLAGSRSQDGSFSTAQIYEIFEDMRVPAPANVSAALGVLDTRGLVLKLSGGRRALTPEGRESVAALGLESLHELDPAELDRGSQFGHVDHTILPAWAAPPRWGPGIARLLDKHPFDSNVFAMTRFPTEGEIPDPVAAAIEWSRDELGKVGLTLHLATDSIVDDDLFGNVGAYMWACRYGLGFVEDLVGKGLNYNAVIEIGGMAITGRRCAILKDPSAPPLPTDLVGQIYRPVEFSDEHALRKVVSTWATSDLRVGN